VDHVLAPAVTGEVISNGVPLQQGQQGHQGPSAGHPGRSEAAGGRTHVTDLTKGRRVTGGDRDELASSLKQRYESGASIRDLASDTGRSYGFVHRILSEAGATLRGRGGATRGKTKATT
jgi:hypothetical protein